MPMRKKTITKTTTVNPLYRKRKYVSTTGAPMRKASTKYGRVYKKAPYKKRLTAFRKVPTIYNSYQTLETYQGFQPVKADKIGSINNQLYYDPITPVNFNINGLLGASASQHANMRIAFKFIRIKSLVIKITPETWSSSTLQTGTVAPFLTDGEKPKIHWVNDDGSFGLGLATDPSGTAIASETIANAEKQGGRVKKEAYFTKPFTFKLKQYSKNLIPTETSANLGSQPDTYRSYGKWMPIATIGSSLQSAFANLFFGFTNVQADFKYKVEIYYTLGFKETV